MLFLYNALLLLTAFFWAPYMILKSRVRKEQPNWSERAGDYELPAGRNPQRVWVHAVSVGEVMASLPVLAELRKELPGWQIVLSVTTSTGWKTAQDQCKDLADHIIYFPIDLPRFTLRGIARVKPCAIALMESELWLNFLWTARQLEIPTLLINGRISSRTAERGKWIKPYYQEIFHLLTSCLVQSELDKTRAASLGAKDPQVVGNSKFDQALATLSGKREDWRAEIGAGPEDQVIVVGSTRGPEEEDLVLAALEEALKGSDRVRVVFAPRHPDQSKVGEKILARMGQAAFRSKGEKGPWLVLDTLGELGPLFSAADIAVIGGGFQPLGGQNLIQPLAHGVPVIHGPHMSNFRDAASLASEAGATLVAATQEELSQSLSKLLDQPDLRRKMGEAGKRMVESGRGASSAYAQAIARLARERWEARDSELKKIDAKKAAKK